ncbi:MAG TPA: hypothetical protein VGJ26_05640, partial [Pirellulales bacterium]
KAASGAMADLAEAIQGLVQQMRLEQQTIRGWVDSQAEQHREIKELLQMSRQQESTVNSILSSAGRSVEEKA